MDASAVSGPNLLAISRLSKIISQHRLVARSYYVWKTISYVQQKVNHFILRVVVQFEYLLGFDFAFFADSA